MGVGLRRGVRALAWVLGVGVVDQRGCPELRFSGGAGVARRSIERCLRNRRSGFICSSPSFRGAEPSSRPATPCPGWEEASCLSSHITDPSAVGIQLVRPRRSGCVESLKRCRAAARVVANALASKEGPLGLHWQPPALGLPRACHCDARRSPTDRRVNHGHVNRDGPPRVHLRLRRRADGRRPHRQGDADL